MKTIDILRQQAPGLAERIETTGESDLQKLAWAAARAAVKRSGLSDPVIEEALQRGMPDAALQARVQLLAAQLDEHYFALKEPLEDREDAGNTDPQVALAFSKARAASAVAEALGDDAKEGAASAAYEALAAVDDPQYLTDALAT
jgi:hypothetical protein